MNQKIDDKIETQIVLSTITDYYLSSKDFNGCPTKTILSNINLNMELFQLIIIDLLNEEKISLNYGDGHPNPFVKAFKPESIDIQLEKITKIGLDNCCFYPSPQHLTTIVDSNQYFERPFTLKLALGEPQLTYYSFDLSVLEFYRNDPRYCYSNTDISGSVGVKDEFYDSECMKDSDKINLQTFGFSYNERSERAVAVYLWYLFKLTPQHQQIWNAKILDGSYKLHPDYYERTILGNWTNGISIFDALLCEIRNINESFKIIGLCELFRTDYSDQKPPEFTFLIRPTEKEYKDFIHLLDKILSENLNKSFFKPLGISFERETEICEGKVRIDQKGTIQLLEEWLNRDYHPVDNQVIPEIIKPLKEVRIERQKPAHIVNDNSFDQKYLLMQKEIMIKVYTGIRNLRIILSTHPKMRGHKLPYDLSGTNIWTE
nr:hypothetical protein [uncultured Methanospirillum sp.]